MREIGTICDGRFATRFARIDSRESFAIETTILIARQPDSLESLEFPIRANRVIRANRANRFARITPLSICPSGVLSGVGKSVVSKRAVWRMFPGPVQKTERRTQKTE